MSQPIRNHDNRLNLALLQKSKHLFRATRATLLTVIVTSVVCLSQFEYMSANLNLNYTNGNNRTARPRI